MKATTAIGIVIAFVGLAAGATMEGSQIPAFFNVPALVIIMSGTIGAVMASTSFESMKAIPTLYKKAIGGAVPDLNERAQLLVGLAERARREGLLALDDEIGKIDDEFVKKGLQLVVDGTDADIVAEVLEIETEAMGGRHSAAGKVFKDAGGFSPTIGIIGTVMGLIHVLENLDNPETLGPAISGAFIATLYGVAMANVIFLPTANRLAGLSRAELDLRTLTLEGILGIQAGDNPRILAEKLQSFIPPAERKAAQEGSTASAAAGAPAVDAVPAAEAA
jgi:chemotaxis protein MotA